MPSNSSISIYENIYVSSKLIRLHSFGLDDSLKGCFVFVHLQTRNTSVDTIILAGIYKTFLK